MIEVIKMMWHETKFQRLNDGSIDCSQCNQNRGTGIMKSILFVYVIMNCIHRNVKILKLIDIGVVRG